MSKEGNLSLVDVRPIKVDEAKTILQRLKDEIRGDLNEVAKTFNARLCEILRSNVHEGTDLPYDISIDCKNAAVLKAFKRELETGSHSWTCSVGGNNTLTVRIRDSIR